MRKLFLFCITWLCVTVTPAAEPVFTLDPLSFFADSANHRQFELNLMVQRASLDWRAGPDGASAGYEARLRVTKGFDTIADTTWERRDWQATGQEIGLAEKIPDQCILTLPAGPYRFQLRVRDRHSGLQSSKDSRVDLSEAEQISSLRLGVQQAVPAQDSLFARRGWFLVPYADALYGQGLEQLFAVAEVYPALPATDTRWTLRVLGERQNVVESTPWAPLENCLLADGPVQLLGFAQDLGHLPSGTYFVELALEHQGHVQQSRHSVWLKNPQIAAFERELISDEYDTYGPEELNLLWDASRILASELEVEAWTEMDLRSRREFMRQFWERRDSDPATLVNEWKLTVLQRVEEAKRLYGEPGTEGHMSERGRTFVRFGPPDEKERDFGTLNSRYEFSLTSYGSSSGMGSGSYLGSDHRDFELWIYDRLDGGVEFIFIDLQGFGEYEMVHSTKTGEYFDPDWARKLFR